jgi:membrane-associated phospholipid phosphatase
MIYKNIPWLLRIICALTLGLACFSRSYLGVHLLYDVFMGGASGLFIMILTSLLLKWADDAPIWIG